MPASNIKLGKYMVEKSFFFFFHRKYFWLSFISKCTLFFPVSDSAELVGGDSWQAADVLQSTFQELRKRFVLVYAYYTT